MIVDGAIDIPSRIATALQNAAKATGVQFDYLLKTAVRESNLDPNAKSTTSSATGLFQFIDQTWLATLKESGAVFGYGRYAQAIERGPDGRYAVADAAARREIMALRYNPEANAALAGAFTQKNAAELAERLGRQPTQGELYIAHFLGAQGAGRLISGAQDTPGAKAADLFPRAARANRSIFYARDGSPRTLAETYKVLVAKHESRGTAVARRRVEEPAAAEMPTGPLGNAFAAALKEPAAVFHGLFRGGSEPVSPKVQQIWADGSRAPVRTAAVQPQMQPQRKPTEGKAGGPLDLFQFLRADIRATIAHG